MPENFFSSFNKAEDITVMDYAHAQNHVKSLESTTRNSYESIYIIDYYAMNFMYISPNPLFLCGHTPEEVMQMGYDFYIKHVPAEEQDILFKMNSIGFKFINEQPIDQRVLFTLSYTFRVINNGKKMLMCHKLTPLEMDRHGNVWLAVCHMSLSSHDKPGNLEIRKAGQSSFWKYDMASKEWIITEEPKLTGGEKDVLLLSVQGMTVEEIAINVGRTKEAIKSRRKSIYEKLNVRNMAEAIVFAMNHKLI